MSIPVEFAPFFPPEHVPEAPLPEVVGAWGNRYGLYVSSETPRSARARDGDVLFLVLAEQPEGVFTVEVLHRIDAHPPADPPVPPTGRWRPAPGVEVRAGDVVLVHNVDLSPDRVWEALPDEWPRRLSWVSRLEAVTESELRRGTARGALYVYDRPGHRWQVLVMRRPLGWPARTCDDPDQCGPDLSLLYDLGDLTTPGLWDGSEYGWTRRDPRSWVERVAEAVEAGGAVARVVATQGETLPDGSCRYEMGVVEATTGPLAPGERVTVDMDRVWCWLDLGRPLDGWTTLLPEDDGTWRSPAWWSTEREDARTGWPDDPLPPALQAGEPLQVEPHWLVRNGNLFPAAWTRATGAVLGPAVCTVP